MIRRILFVVAGLVVVAVVVVLLAADAADDGDDVATDDGAPGTSAPETTTTTRGTGAAGEGGTIAAVDGEGRLVVLDADTGEMLRVALDGIAVDDPAKNDVAVTPDGDVAFVVLPGVPALRDEPPDIARVALDGGDADVVAAGYAPSVSPDGTTLAYATVEGIVLLDLETDQEQAFRREQEPEFTFIADTAWSADGSTLLFVAGEIRTGLYALDIDTATSLDTARRLGPDARGEDASWRAVTAHDVDRLAVVETCCDVGEKERWLVLAVHLPTGQVEGGLLPGERVEASALDAGADGSLLYLTNVRPGEGVLWRWDGTGQPVRLAGEIVAAAW